MPNQIPTNCYKKENQTRFTLWVAGSMVFFWGGRGDRDLLTFVLARKAVSQVDRQMALVIVAVKYNF